MIRRCIVLLLAMPTILIVFTPWAIYQYVRYGKVPYDDPLSQLCKWAQKEEINHVG